MPGTRSGGLKARQTNIKLYGDDFYKKIGSLGGRAIGYKGFAANPELARKAGSKGGKKSRRTDAPAKPKGYYYSGPRELDKSKRILPPEPKPEPKRGFKSWVGQMVRRAHK